MKKSYLVGLCFSLLSLPVWSEIRNVDGRWLHFVEGKAYPIKGMTFGKKIEASAIDEDFRILKDLGVNTIRTWGTGAEAPILLDAAQRHGLKVMAGIWLRHGRPGAEGDDSFNWLRDEKGKQEQWDNAIKTVQKYKDHPAILFWGLGNEVFLNCASEDEKVAYAQFLGKLCKEIKRLDPKHLISSSCAWTLGWPYWEKYCPDLDVYGVNSYGPGVTALSDEATRLGIKKPYVLTEFGARGEWDAPKDKNGLRKEPTDKEKTETFSMGWHEWIEIKPQCLGGFIFNYGDTHHLDHASIWLNLKILDSYRPQYWATRYALTGKAAPNHFPSITKLEFPKDMGKQDTWVDVELAVEDADDPELEIKFYYNQRLEGASREKRDRVTPLKYRGTRQKGFQIRLPKENGLIKIYAFAKDSTNNLAIAFQSFVISDKDPSEGLGRAGKAPNWPHYIYKDEGSKDHHYIPSGYMGSQVGSVKIDPKFEQNPQAGHSCLKVTYTEQGGWFGLCWQDPMNDWGAEYGGYNLTGAKKLTFWARSDDAGVKVKFGFGMITRDKTWYDTATGDTGDVILEKTWKKYEIALGSREMSRIKTGFYFFTGGHGKPFTFYIDQVCYEKDEATFP